VGEAAGDRFPVTRGALLISLGEEALVLAPSERFAENHPTPASRTRREVVRRGCCSCEARQRVMEFLALLGLLLPVSAFEPHKMLPADTERDSKPVA
jgi:hypothetical protein